MNRLLNTIGVVLLMTGLALAQDKIPAPKAGQNSNSQPAAQSKKKLPEAKTKAEFDAYNQVVANTDTAAMEAATNDFIQKYPNSELPRLLYTQLMQRYQMANEAEKVVEMGRKVLAIAPDDTLALVMTAATLAERTRDTDLDRNERYEESMRNAKMAIETIDTGLLAPPTTPPDQLADAKNSLLAIAHAAMGYVELNNKNYEASEKHFQTAVDLGKSQPDAISLLRLAIAQDNQKKYEQAIVNVDKAIALAHESQNFQVETLAKNEKDRLTKLAGTK